MSQSKMTDQDTTSDRELSNQQTHPVDGPPDVKIILASLIAVALLVAGGVGVADWVGWIDVTIPDVSLPF